MYSSAGEQYYDRLQPKEKVSYQLFLNGIQHRARRVSTIMTPDETDSIRRIFSSGESYAKASYRYFLQGALGTEQNQ